MQISNLSTALGISGQMSQTSQAIERSLQRLSTGKRLNSPKDGSADYSAYISLDAQSRGLRQANQNINSSLGMLQAADSAMSVQLDIVQRMRELAVQAASDTLTAGDRSALQTQITSLREEFSRITNETEFNGTKLLDGSFGSKTIQIGAYSGNTTNIDISSLQASAVFEKSIGSGSFSLTQTISMGDAFTDSITVDLDSDGILDLITADNGTDNRISVRLGNGDGTFGARTTYAGAGTPVDIKAADINNDGVIDILVSDDGATESIYVYEGNGDGSFKAAQSYVVDEVASSEFEVADFNGDGYADIVAGNNTTAYSILFNNGDGTFATQQTFASSVTTNQIKSGDIDGDGDIDFISTTTSGTAQVFLNNGSGNFTGLTSFDAVASISGATISLKDYNNDGTLDLLAAAGSNTTIAYLKGNQDGTFATAVNYTAHGSIVEMRAFDYNNDGNLDILARTSANWELAAGNGAGVFTQIRTAALAGTPSVGLMVGDFNGDGIQDFIEADLTNDRLMFYKAAETTQSAVGDIDVSTSEKASRLVTYLDNALANLLGERSSIAQSLEQLQSAMTVNETQSVSLEDAKSNISDADIALETSELVRNQILQQAQIAAFGQSNSNAQVVLGILNLL
ncbi:MAG: hypothetical protein COV44_01430 [Deltaproteobacteria bacterium CG11_big_fil_rev_8_21_14_0_20_45_16]|nr:MAG: hypothetical protein COV44_01430 [Deltaproteobacteria bacterium CG11_big_fil_rev_8_21_14_0_20_45_16]